MVCVAEDGDVTVSWLIRRLMRDFLEHREREGSSRLDLGRPDKTVAADA